MGDKIEFDVGPCKAKGGISVKPKNQIKLDLNKIKTKYEVLLDTQILIVIKHKELGEIVIHSYGEMIFKDSKDENKIKEFANGIFKNN